MTHISIRTITMRTKIVRVIDTDDTNMCSNCKVINVLVLSDNGYICSSYRTYRFYNLLGVKLLNATDTHSIGCLVLAAQVFGVN